MVMLIEYMNNYKSYKLETLYLAVSLADRYLVNIAVQGEQAPCLITLGMTCLLIAAKLEEPVSPSYKILIRTMNDLHKANVQKRDLLRLEEKILIALEFSCHHISPIPFLERYFRIFGIDNGIKDRQAHQLRTYARQYCRFMQREPCFLNFRPSQIAAASLMFAINISQSDIANEIGLKKIDEASFKSLFFETSIYLEISGKKVQDEESICALRMWSASIEKLTCVKKQQDVAPVYRMLAKKLDEVWYDHKLNGDQKLFELSF